MYACPKHGCDLVSRVHIIPAQCGVKRNQDRRIEFFACPHVDFCPDCTDATFVPTKSGTHYCRTCNGAGIVACGYVKPNKWQKRKPGERHK